MEGLIIPANLDLVDDEFQALMEVAGMERMSFSEACQLLVSIGYRVYWEKWDPQGARCALLQGAGERTQPHNDDTRAQLVQWDIPF